MEEKMEGTVKWFNNKKGYGFVSGEENQEYFVHYTALPQGLRLRENDIITFDPVDSERGKQAQNVALAKKASERTDLPEEGSESEESPVIAEQPSMDEEETKDLPEEGSESEESPVIEEQPPMDEKPANPEE